MLRAIFRKPGQSVPQPIPIVSEDTAVHGIDKVLFKNLSHKAENKKDQLSVTLEFWEYIPQIITAKKSSSTDKAAQASSNLNSDYKNYLSNNRGKPPAIDDASTSDAMNRVTQMPY